MKVSLIKIRQEPYKSFIFRHDKAPYSTWHQHPEYELVLILKGEGKRMVGDHVARFKKDDLVFLGPYLPHQWECERLNGEAGIIEQNEAFVIQFRHEFLGNGFFEAPENLSLKRFLDESNRGYEIYGKGRDEIISVMQKMAKMTDVKRLYALFNIFEIMGSINEYHTLASPLFKNDNSLNEDEPLQLAIQYILQNFQNKIQIQELLDLTNMSYATFYSAFKKLYMISFKDYLLNVRIGYACKLLTEGTMHINEIAFESGFENLSNFNRQFKRIKNITPSKFQKQYRISSSGIK